MSTTQSGCWEAVELLATHGADLEYRCTGGWKKGLYARDAAAETRVGCPGDAAAYDASAARGLEVAAGPGNEVVDACALLVLYDSVPGRAGGVNM